jgi:hypothetical protein
MPPAKTVRKASVQIRRRAGGRAASGAVKQAPRGSGSRTMSAAHKRALAEGRTMSATVDRYLVAVNTPKRRGRKVTKATLEQRLAEARLRLKSAKGVDKVLAAQEIRDLEAKTERLTSSGGADMKALESDFIRIAKRFGENRGVGYGAWRDAGVPAEVLRKAGVARTRG